jgi:phospholipid/cholesterol/gamma-HCH transport system permease protein
MKTSIPPTISFNSEKQVFELSGSWTIQSISSIIWPDIHQYSFKIILDGSLIQKMDSAGAYALIELRKKLNQRQQENDLIGLCEEKQQLYHLIEKKLPPRPEDLSKTEKKPFFERVGREAYLKYLQFIGLLTLVGDLLLTIKNNIGNWKRFHLDYIFSNVAQTGIFALPILALLSFLIGVVLAYQMGLQLETYGANIFIAYLCGMAIFREFGPLITAIIVAGRTSSAFTAQLGSMKLNEEIDALETMGLSPTEFLVAPKVIGLSLVFPLLIFWSNLFGILGAMFMSKIMLHIGYHDFLIRLQESVGLKQMMLGLYKSPAFSILIALVGCFQGFQVGNSADSVGHQTTKSVVQALFLIIITDAIYSIIYSALDL